MCALFSDCLGVNLTSPLSPLVLDFFAFNFFNCGGNDRAWIMEKDLMCASYNNSYYYAVSPAWDGLTVTFLHICINILITALSKLTSNINSSRKFCLNFQFISSIIYFHSFSFFSLITLTTIVSN